MGLFGSLFGRKEAPKQETQNKPPEDDWLKESTRRANESRRQYAEANAEGIAARQSREQAAFEAKAQQQLVEDAEAAQSAKEAAEREAA